MTHTYPHGEQVARAYTARGQLDGLGFTGSMQLALAGTTPVGLDTNGDGTVDVTVLQNLAAMVYDVLGREDERRLGNGITEIRTWRDDHRLATVSTPYDPEVIDFSYNYDANKRKTAEHDHTALGFSQHFAAPGGGSGYDAEDRLKPRAV